MKRLRLWISVSSRRTLTSIWTNIWGRSSRQTNSRLPPAAGSAVNGQLLPFSFLRETESTLGLNLCIHAQASRTCLQRHFTNKTRKSTHWYVYVKEYWSTEPALSSSSCQKHVKSFLLSTKHFGFSGSCFSIRATEEGKRTVAGIARENNLLLAGLRSSHGRRREVEPADPNGYLSPRCTHVFPFVLPSLSEQQTPCSFTRDKWPGEKGRGL
ncbi:hypothetical protein EYF80_060841 [Liparis tanakae]|uniref:Uncharacterized protein n=1 Tax=Liparis tanakae TaxID=230148 RepID=A0A4Z2EJL4_9TELE|nr:hypothetical protein EYF80_060841 [Liparis tanakae]